MILSASRKLLSWVDNYFCFWHRPAGSIVWMSLIASASAQTQAANSEPQYLSDHPELILASSQGWGELGWNVAAHTIDKSGEPLRIGERPFTKGLGHHASGRTTSSRWKNASRRK